MIHLQVQAFVLCVAMILKLDRIPVHF